MKKELEKKILQAIKLLKSAEKKAKEFNEPVEIGYSGGKDSDVILRLAKIAGINYKAIYKNTTIDPPGTIRHALNMGAEMRLPKRSFFKIIEAKGFPTFYRRFCCKELKEYKILNVVVIGVRKAESTKRKILYNEPTECRYYRKRKTEKNHVHAFYPILNWSDNDVLEFIQEYKIKCAPHYYDKDGNFHIERRLGCMCCPLKSDRGLAEFKEHPNLAKLWIKAGQKWFDTHKIEKTKAKFRNPYRLFANNVFFHSYEDFRLAVDGGLFGPIDCKKALEDYFKIKL